MRIARVPAALSNRDLEQCFRVWSSRLQRNEVEAMVACPKYPYLKFRGGEGGPVTRTGEPRMLSDTLQFCIFILDSYRYIQHM
jgi:hypothetical protein